MSAALLVADSGPLIALARLDCLDLPARYFESVLITATVWEEVTRKPGVDEAPRLASAATAKLIRVVADPEAIPESLLRTTIDAGERVAIALGIELNACLLIDDRRARQVAIEDFAALYTEHRFVACIHRVDVRQMMLARVEPVQIHQDSVKTADQRHG